MFTFDDNNHNYNMREFGSGACEHARRGCCVLCAFAPRLMACCVRQHATAQHTRSRYEEENNIRGKD